MRTCVLHPDREANRQVQGHLVCNECFAKNQEERSLNLPFEKRLFLQSILGAGYQLEEAAWERGRNGN